MLLSSLVLAALADSVSLGVGRVGAGGVRSLLAALGGASSCASLAPHLLHCSYFLYKVSFALTRDLRLRLE